MKVFFSLFIAGLVFSSAPQAQTHPSLPALKQELATITDRWNAEFKSGAVLRYDEALPLVLGCIPHSRGQAIFLCDSVLNLLLDSNSEEIAHRTAHLILFHELTHLILTTQVLKPAELKEAGVTLPQISYADYEFLVTNAQHDNIDGLAAKIMRDFGYPLPSDLKALDLTDSIDTSPIPEDAFFLLQQTFPVRFERIAHSYIEGWDSWKEYEPLVTPCTSFSEKNTAVYDYLKKKLRDSSTIGSAACQNFEKNTLEATFTRYGKLFHLIQ
jgi:hypothetical protein